MAPAASPTSQYEPCSDANSAATIQNAEAVYVPGGTFSKFGLMIQRISHARQNNSSTMGTMITARRLRRASTAALDRAPSESDPRAVPVIEFEKSQKWR